MKTVGFIPSRLNSDRVPFKNIRPLGGMPLVNYAVRTLNKVKGVDEVVLFASEPSICQHLKQGLQCRFVKRPEFLDTSTTTIQDLIREFLAVYPADIVVLLHISSPFLRPETIEECLEAVQSGRHDSAFTAVEVKKFCWFRERPLNYSLEGLTPRTQDLDPVLVEQSSLYVFTTQLFRETSQRVSLRSYIKRIDHFEGHDIDTEEDFRVAELIVNTGVYTLA